MARTVPKTRGWVALKKIREKLKQKELVERTGVSQSKLSLIENLLRRPSLDESVALERVGIEQRWWSEFVDGPKRRQRREA